MPFYPLLDAADLSTSSMTTVRLRSLGLWRTSIALWYQWDASEDTVLTSSGRYWRTAKHHPHMDDVMGSSSSVNWKDSVSVSANGRIETTTRQPLQPSMP
uniref:(northern house mosquito) hypothetical protein n=1 Tax=Culex pipiens TaxID=7175 RepID=A0A8D8AG69_CULPI